MIHIQNLHQESSKYAGLVMMLILRFSTLAETQSTSGIIVSIAAIILCFNVSNTANMTSDPRKMQ